MQGITMQQGAAIRAERNATRREVLKYLVEGDRQAALDRMMRGFQRQVRLAGLERAVLDAHAS